MIKRKAKSLLSLLTAATIVFTPAVIGSATANAASMETVSTSATDASTLTNNIFNTVGYSNDEYQTLTNDSKISSTSITKGDAVTVTGSATGGTSPYTYEYYYKKSTASSWMGAGTGSSAIIKPYYTGTYTVRVKVTDANGTVSRKDFTVTVNDTLKNTSTLTASNIVYGQGVTLQGSATGGIGSYQYEMNVKHSTDLGYTNLKSFDSTATKYWIPARTGTYYVVIIVKDSSGKISQKNFTITVKKAELENTSVISTTSITKGSTVKVTGAATGGTAPYSYKYYYKKSTSSSWMGAGTGSSATIKPYYTGTYTVRVKVTDANGVVSRKDLTVTVNDTLKNTSTVTASNIVYGQGVTLQGSATGGIGSYQYEMNVKHSTDSGYTNLKGFDSTATKYWIPDRTGIYDVVIRVRDSSGEISQKNFTITVTKSEL